LNTNPPGILARISERILKPCRMMGSSLRNDALQKRYQLGAGRAVRHDSGKGEKLDPSHDVKFV